MKHFISVMASVLLLLVPHVVMSRHVIGGDLLYTHISGNTYKLTLTLYGDCYSKSSFDLLAPATPSVDIFRSGSLVQIAVLRNVSGAGTDVSPVCPSEISNTTCNGGTLPGVFQFVYVDTISLPGLDPDWKFVFNGTLGASIAGRSVNITNVSGVGGTYMQLTATLDNTLGPNSSPQYATVPTGYYCNNVLQQYNQGASDANGDSLYFSLVPAIDTATGASVNYVFPYTATVPIGTAPGNFNFNSLNGQLDFTPNTVQGALIVNRVSEYRGGKLVGTSEREMTFIVRDDCSGTPPSPYVSSLSGGVLQSGNVISLCKGGGTVSFSVNMANPDHDTILITPTDIPSGASLTVINNHTTDPKVNFSWNTASLAVGAYSFHLAIKNNHCPISSFQSVAYTIHVVNPPTITATQLSATNCVGKAAMRYDLLNGFTPRTVSILQGGTFIKEFLDTTGTDSAGVVFDSLTAGTYTVTVNSDSLCSATATFTIVDSGTLPVRVPLYSLCKSDSVVVIKVDPLITAATTQYYNLDGSVLGTNPVVNASVPGTFSWYVEQRYKVCSSGKVLVKVVVHPLPNVEIAEIPETICYGDQVYLTATGAATYTWQPADLVKYDTGAYIVIYAAQEIHVTGVDSFGCIDTASAMYDNVQKCCRLSYPTAFTPNDDGRNDGWKVVTYGNMEKFDLQIFNRWGQKVFVATDAHQRWDGNYLGSPCEIGTYFFLVDAKCITGPKKFYKGEFTLIR